MTCIMCYPIHLSLIANIITNNKNIKEEFCKEPKMKTLAPKFYLISNTMCDTFRSIS